MPFCDAISAPAAASSRNDWVKGKIEDGDIKGSV